MQIVSEEDGLCDRKRDPLALPDAWSVRAASSHEHGLPDAPLRLHVYAYMTAGGRARRARAAAARILLKLPFGNPFPPSFLPSSAAASPSVPSPFRSLSVRLESDAAAALSRSLSLPRGQQLAANRRLTRPTAATAAPFAFQRIDPSTLHITRRGREREIPPILAAWLAA